jgi:adenylosuccinate synthase
VGAGPFPTELNDAQGEALRQAGNEFGSTTGRPRRCGWIDLVQLQYACRINGVTSGIVTKIDVLNDLEHINASVAYNVEGERMHHMPYHLTEGSCEPVYESFSGWKSSLKDCTVKNDLPENAFALIHFFEKYLDIPVDMISTGPERESLIVPA